MVFFIANRLACAGNYVVAWGDNTDGETNVPPGLTNVLAIAAGDEHSLALRADGTVIAWGKIAASPTNIVVAGLSNVVAIAAGGTQNLALKNDGTIAIWYFSNPPTNAVPGSTNFVALACGNDHNLALKADGTIYAWGKNYSGQTNVPVDLSNVVAIAAGNSSSFAIRDDGSTWLSGQFTNQSNTFHSNVVAAAVVSGGEQGIALLGNGNGHAWGFPNGTNVVTVSNVTAVAGISPFNQAGAVWALRNDGTLTGLGYDSQLEMLGQTNVWMNLSNVLAIASGYTHHLAIVGDSMPNPIEPIVNAGFNNGQFTISQPTSLGRSYRLEFKNALTDAWQIFQPTPGNGTIQILADPNPPPDQRFYRVYGGQ